MKKLIASLAFVTAASAASADVITFGTADVDHLASTGVRTEGAFQYSAVGAGWELQIATGNPPAALATVFNLQSSSPGDTVTFTRIDGGLFSFGSIDWATPNTVSDDVLIEGFLGNSLIGSLTLDGFSADWRTYITAAGFAGDLDMLRIRVTVSDRGAMLMDNLVLNPIAASTVPEPDSLALLGLGLAGLIATRKRKKG